MNKRDEYINYALCDLPSSVENLDLSVLDMTSVLDRNEDRFFEPHTHKFYEMLWFKKGESVHYVDFKEYPVSPDTMFFISPGQIHCFGKQASWEGYGIQFNESFLSDDESSESIFLKYDMFNAFDTSPCFSVSPDYAPYLEMLVKSMKREMHHAELFAHKDCLKSLLKLLLIGIRRTGKRGTDIPLCINNSANRTFVRFRQRLEQHYREMHTVKEYADCLNVSARTLTNSVYESSHNTPLKLINDRILLEAKRLLRYSSLKVKEIAFLLGSEDPSYFVKFFKRQAGCLPAEFREQ